MISIRRQLLFWQIGALLATGAVASLLTYSLAWDAFNRQRDYGLEQIAYSIVRHGVVLESGESESDTADAGQFVSQIWNADGSLAYTSIEGAGPPPQAPGLHSIVWQGEEWHLYTLKDGGLTIQVGNPVTRRARIFAGVVPWLLLPLSVFILLLGSIIWFSVGRGLAPLQDLRTELRQRDFGSLEPLDTAALPPELVPLVKTLNELLARLDAAIHVQTRFVADAAHELRSPLAAVRLQAQLARVASGEAAAVPDYERLMAGVDRATHLVEQLLRLARVEPAAWRGTLQAVSLDQVARKVVADQSTLAESRRIDLGLASCTPVTVAGDADGLEAMLGNLVDNALRYIPAGGRVDVELRATERVAVLSVTDNGPGIAAAERERVFDRFYRIPGTQASGSGLGLAIVRQVAALHHGRLEIGDAPGGGLSVRVTLPRV